MCASLLPADAWFLKTAVVHDIGMCVCLCLCRFTSKAISGVSELIWIHMIGLTNIPMTVLFGPTNSKKFAPDQKNVKILDSNKMYGVKDINKITVDDVLETLNF